MKPKAFILFILAAGCGLVAMLGVKQVLSDKNNVVEEPKVKVLHAKARINSHVPLTPEMVEFREIPKSAVPFGAVTKPEEYKGRALRSGAVKNEIIMMAKLGDRGDFDASSSIPEGMRLVSVPVNLTTSHSGLIRPRDRVDVLVTFEAPSGASRGSITTTKTILDYIEVFAIDDRTPEQDANQKDVLAKNVSLLVTPQQAQLVMLAQKKGVMHLALRPKNDMAKTKAVPSNEQRDLWQGQLVRGVRDVKGEGESADSGEELGELTEADVFGMEFDESAPMDPKVLEALAELQQRNADLEALMRQLQEDSAKPAVETPGPVAVAPAPKKKETWSVMIYSGEQRKETKFELQDKASSDSEEPAADAVDAPAGETSSSEAEPLTNRTVEENATNVLVGR